MKGATIELEPTPEQCGFPRPYQFDTSRMEKIDLEVKMMLRKGIIEKVENRDDVFVPNIFARNKSNGKLRIILDLSAFNEHVEYNILRWRVYNKL